MPVTAIVGAQWGDEGKGKITDLLSQDADLVMRYGGGGNAGHTVVNRFGEFRLHLVPSGIFSPRATALVGTGTVVDFDFLSLELEQLSAAGVSTDRLRISSRAHVVMPYHLMLDRLGDEARGAEAIGTTRRGVGPAYVDKADRVGIQVADLLDPPTLRRKLCLLLPQKNRLLSELYGEPALELGDLLDRAEGWRERYGGLIVDQVPLVQEALDKDRAILLEGQLGAMRDLDWGTYPFVTSSTTIAGGGAVGGGIPPTRIDRVVGVVKAYTTAVGAGPLPTELRGARAEDLRERGGEYGATTGRPRRVGWFDAVAVRFGHLLNRFSGIAVTKLDVLDGMPSLCICTAYRRGSERFHTVPTAAVLEQVEPEYEEIEGWSEPTSHATSWDDLPPAAQAYLRRIESLVGAPVRIVSVGRDREETIIVPERALIR
ncbi:MAG: adenylosuccinate synthase [Chloroflexi bacterium]|nr:adenylosuccinate synthase [Chloroflexota bacterium]